MHRNFSLLSKFFEESDYKYLCRHGAMELSGKDRTFFVVHDLHGSSSSIFDRRGFDSKYNRLKALFDKLDLVLAYSNKALIDKPRSKSLIVDSSEAVVDVDKQVLNADQHNFVAAYLEIGEKCLRRHKTFADYFVQLERRLDIYFGMDMNSKKH